MSNAWTSNPINTNPFGNNYNRKAVEPPSEIKNVVDKALKSFVDNNSFGIPPEIAQTILNSFNPLEGIEGEFGTALIQEELKFLPAKITHKGGQANEAFNKAFPTYGKRAMAFGAVAMTVENALAATGLINGVVYGVFTEFSNTNWRDVERDGFDKQSVQKNTYSVYRMFITPLVGQQAMSPSALYKYKKSAASPAPSAPFISRSAWSVDVPTNPQQF